MAIAKRVPVPVPQQADLVKVRVSGAGLLTPLRSSVEKLSIQSPEDYAEADFLLAKIKSGRLAWEQKINPILGPLKAMAANLKAAMKGAKDLDGEVSGGFDLMEEKVKDEMAGWKREEQRQIAEVAAEANRKARQLQEEADKKARLAISARTPQIRAKLEQARAELETQAETVKQEAVASVEVAQGTASSVRTVKVVRIANVGAFLGALKDYQPRAGIYDLKHPPLSVLTCKVKRDGTISEEDSALSVVLSEVRKIYSTQPGVVATWPGVVIEDEILIANR